MLIWGNKIPSYLVQKKNIVQIVTYTAVFALAFINIYSPFGVDKWYNVTKPELFFYSSLVILTGIFVVVVSRVIMYYYAKNNEINYWQFVVWVAAEILSMAAVYTVFVLFILNDGRDYLEVLKVTIKNTALVLLFPYSVLWLYFSWKEKTDKLEEFESSDSLPTNTKTMIPFHDEKGALRFSLKLDDLLYLEAADNYVTIYYLDNRKISKFLVRNTLKNLEQQFKFGNIVRCHRSYMVNFEKVKIIRKEKDGLHLELDTESSFDLPVSKTYVPIVLESFSKYTPFKTTSSN